MIVMLSFGIVGCSSNTQSQNTGIGAVTGAVAGGLLGSAIGGGAGKAVAVGVGAVAGALLGGYIGHNMDHSDQMQMNSAMDNPTHKTTYWKNTRTGTTYKVTPVSAPKAMNGYNNCRKYRTTAIMNGKTQNVYGVACKMSDGTWKAMNN
jgi:surface antigen